MAGGAIRVGIGGWTFAGWRGSFYPPGFSQARELEHAAGVVQAIEINATFYRMQSPDSFRRWAAATQPGFVFSVKGSRFCTNRKRLGDAGEALAGFFGQGIAELGDRLGPVVWQFAATKRFEADDLAAFLRLLPTHLGGRPLRHALEVRHPSFEDPAFFALAREHEAAVVLLDPAPFAHVPTAGFTYARLQAMREEEPAGYGEAELDGWADAARRAATRGDVFMFMINGAKVRAPAAAQALIARLGDRRTPAPSSGTS